MEPSSHTDNDQHLQYSSMLQAVINVTQLPGCVYEELLMRWATVTEQHYKNRKNELAPTV